MEDLKDKPPELELGTTVAPATPSVITGTVAITLDPVAVANLLRRQWPVEDKE